MPIDRTEVEAVSNPAYEDVSVERAKSIAKSESLQVKLRIARQKHAVALEELKKLNETEVAVNQLKRKVEVEKSYLSSFVSRRGDVNLMNRLDESKVSDVAVHQAGVLWVKHVSPRGSIVPVSYTHLTLPTILLV